MKKHRVPTPQQLQALEDIECHGDPWHHVFGMSQHGGWHRVMLVVEHRAKWARYDKRRERWHLTNAGKAVLRRARERAAKATLPVASAVVGSSIGDGAGAYADAVNRKTARKSTALALRSPEPYAVARLPGVVLLSETDVSARSQRAAIDRLLARLGTRRVSFVIASLEPPKGV